jgi:hypothetical protein
MKAEAVGRPSGVIDDLFPIVKEQMCARQRFTIPGLSCEIAHISRTLLYEISQLLQAVASFEQF